MQWKNSNKQQFFQKSYDFAKMRNHIINNESKRPGTLVFDKLTIACLLALHFV